MPRQRRSELGAEGEGQTQNDPKTSTVSGASRVVPAAMLVVLLTGSFMAAFDFFVVNVAAPSIRLDLNAGEAELELVVGG